VATALTLDLPAKDLGRARELTLGEDRQPERIRTILSRYAGIRRDGAGLNAAADELDTMGTGPLATVARAVVVAATARQDSRGCHWRSDHPHADERRDEHIVVRLDQGGRPTTRRLLASTCSA
jgi:L-aspartate oxidase